MLMKKPAIVCFYIPPITLEIYISQRTTRDITNVLETMIKPWCLSHCRHVVKRDYLQFPYLQWNIEGKLFLLHTKRLNPNAKKIRTNLSCWIRFLTQTLLITSYNVMKGIQCSPSWDSNGKGRNVTDYKTHKMTIKPHDICKSIWLDYYLTTTIFHFFTQASLLFFIS